MADNEKPIEPWFFDLEAPCPLNDEDQERVNVAERCRSGDRHGAWSEHIAIDEDVPAEALTPGFADMAIDRVRDAIHAARNAGPKARPKTDLEELAFRYMDAMRLWLRIYRAAREKQS